ncbi:MAG: methyltransferase domain-containing protein [Rhodospirillaceae bacterium]|nr:methyltransferase domain-containing protein [Rhodospirillaceae bacterium]MBT4043596.1 methyltransferase domain-containing protein [Rhodospirillaceae bacterium]MBT5523473.1 methyltransferase domain-containing protein [Rhodospirillaceae bacterium]MBT6590539.1 methyltransferase domain-containing protein [Rhodospirillaceae bacterium]MBT6909669.1 methyltransferase domain-containing protein [Rhodospirillaceae bacterium]
MARTKEAQYEDCLRAAEESGVDRFGVMTNQIWRDDPRRMAILLSRYKFVAKMLSGKRRVVEVGCGDAFGSRVVLQETGELTVLDIDPVFIQDIEQRMHPDWPMTPAVHDMMSGPYPGIFDAAYSLDVLEHIPQADEETFLRNITTSLNSDGVMIVGMPSLDSQDYASPQSKAGHINCKNGGDFKALMEKFFDNVFVFSMNDEVVHTGFWPMAHYYLALCCGKRPA